MARERASSRDQDGGHKPPQYRLVTLFWSVGLFCGLLAAMKVVSPITAFALSLLLLAIVAHVAGNAIGSRLRDSGTRLTAVQRPEHGSHSARENGPEERDFAPTTQLRDRVSLGRTMIVVTSAGAVFGACAGGSLLAWVNWDQLTTASLMLGAGAFAVIGGFAGFLCSSFCAVFGGALIQAQRDARGQRES